MKDYGRGLAGVIVGIIGTLLLTLEIWGHEPYQVIIAILAGAFFGLFVADYKSAWEITKNIGHSFIKVFEKTEETAGIEKQPISISKENLVSCINFIVPVIFIILLCFSYYMMGNSNKSISTSGAILRMTPMALLLLFLLVKVEETSDVIPEKLQTKIWGQEIPARNALHHLSRDLSFWQIEKKIFITKLFYYATIIFKMLRGIVWLIPILPVLVISIAITVLALPVWIFREAARHGLLLLVLIAIVAGGLIGTYDQSWVYGLGSGFVIFTLSYLLSKIGKLDPLIMFKENGFLHGTVKITNKVLY